MGNKVVEKEVRYVKKRIPVEAIQIPTNGDWDTVENWLRNEVPDWFREAMDKVEVLLDLIENRGFMIQTLEGQMLCPWGSYIIRGIKGELYPCRRDIFEETYESVEE